MARKDLLGKYADGVVAKIRRNIAYAQTFAFVRDVIVGCDSCGIAAVNLPPTHMLGKQRLRIVIRPVT